MLMATGWALVLALTLVYLVPAQLIDYLIVPDHSSLLTFSAFWFTLLDFD